MRGKRFGGLAATLTGRLIPACAGKTPIIRRPSRINWAHPRVCGENQGKRGCCLTLLGSSPRVRGKHTPRTCVLSGGWLIPACAGKTVESLSAHPQAAAHPRVCGENRNGIAGFEDSEGSSPRVRGKPSWNRAVHSGSGLIPACAGKTAREAIDIILTRAHPRVCGENWAVIRIS